MRGKQASGFRLQASGVALGLAAALLSCGGAELSGSVSQYFSLDVSRQEILRDSDAFQVTYFHDTPNQVDVVARLTVVTTGFDFKAGNSFDLAGEYAPGHPRAVVTHAAGGEPSRTLPPVSRGTLTLSSGGQPGQQTRGSFSLSFASDGGDFGQGTDLNGKFDAVAEDASNASGVDGG